MQNLIYLFLANLMVCLPLSGKESSLNIEELSGVYEYVYEHNTPDLIENHYIELDTSKTPAVGTYYGTSDDFDEGREGYFPGFFKAKMSNLELTESTIRFKVVVSNKDMWSHAITPHSKSQPGKKWTVGLRKNERTYAGKVSKNKIIIESGLGPRVFVKRN